MTDINNFPKCLFVHLLRTYLKSTTIKYIKQVCINWKNIINENKLDFDKLDNENKLNLIDRLDLILIVFGR